MKRFSNRNRGFSLIEVAIAIVVIGLIAGFALKGKELINSAKLRSVVDQVNTFKIAVQGFMDKYGALPGDFNAAREMIGDSLQNGRGDGIISSPEDAGRFWQHLVASDLISLELVNGYPRSKVGGYYTVSSQIRNHPGVWIILCKNTNDNQNFKGILSPEDAYYIDRNNDTGNYSTGEIRAIKSLDASGECFIGSQYNTKNKNKDCVLLFKIW
ncbi:MAG: prepilin-type N-terminal cleavage/methylation domain-containing protein [Holosporaceae bacterium]|jgi:prepilin-type N-terminal cleavage/methylation domain-containing protein|nr:prepilin-type N-terminal cleavage/methylation domain-containing protein [Holosporaceae bacterium]